MTTLAEDTFEKILREIVSKGDLSRLEFYISTTIATVSNTEGAAEYSKPGTP